LALGEQRTLYQTAVVFAGQLEATQFLAALLAQVAVAVLLPVMVLVHSLVLVVVLVVAVEPITLVEVLVVLEQLIKATLVVTEQTPLGAFSMVLVVVLVVLVALPQLAMLVVLVVLAYQALLQEPRLLEHLVEVAIYRQLYLLVVVVVTE
jgi:hypothetical protein